MIYDDGVKMNKYMRVIECPCCGNTQLGDEDQYCIICGTSLYNRCEGEAILDNWGNYQGNGEQHNNPSNARYCAFCGAKTEFFNKGFLKPYTEVRDSYQTNEVKNFYPIDFNDSGAETSASDVDDEILPF